MFDRWLSRLCLLLLLHPPTAVQGRYFPSGDGLRPRADDALPGTSKANAPPTTSDANPEFLWRGEYGRDAFTVLNSEGGLTSWGYHYMTEGFEMDMDGASSLYRHAVGRHLAESIYVSTSANPEVGMTCTHVNDPAVPKGTKKFLYRIRPSRRAIPINKSLGAKSPFPLQDEYAVVGFVSSDSIDGFYAVTEENQHEIMESIKSGKPSKYFTSVPKIGKPPPSEPPSGPRYDLAGFSKDDEAWKLPEYAPFKGEKTSESLANFLEKELDSPQQAEAIRRARDGADGAAAEAPPPPESPAPGDKGATPPKPKKKSRFRNVLKKLICKRVISEVSCGDDLLDPEEPPRPEEVEGPWSRPAVVEESLANSAESMSLADFKGELEARDLMSFVKSTWNLTPEGFRARIKYETIEPTEPGLRLTEVGAPVAEIASAGALVVVMWAPGVIESFVRNDTAWNRAASVLSVIPESSCTMQILKNGAQVDGLDTALCFLGDTLILGGIVAFPEAIVLGVLVQIVRGILATFKHPPKLPTAAEIMEERDKVWRTLLTDRLYKYLYSHEYHYPKRSEAFVSKVKGGLVFMEAGILSQGSRAIGVLKATSSNAMNNTVSEEEKGSIRTKADASVKSLRQASNTTIIRQLRNYLIKLPTTLRHNQTASLRAAAQALNKEVTDSLLSRENIAKYPETSWTDYIPTDFVPIMPEDRFVKARQRMKEISQHLEANPPPLPTRFEIAFVMGQMRGLEIDPILVSPQEYLKDKTPQNTAESIQTTCIEHAARIISLLQGKTDDVLVKDFDFDKVNETVDGLLILTAFRFGRYYGEWKTGYLNRHFWPGQPFISDDDIRLITFPLVPPLPKEMDKLGVIPEMLGLSKNIVDSALKNMGV